MKRPWSLAKANGFILVLVDIIDGGFVSVPGEWEFRKSNGRCITMTVSEVEKATISAANAACNMRCAINAITTTETAVSVCSLRI
jgi:hypothetical protein